MAEPVCYFFRLAFQVRRESAGFPPATHLIGTSIRLPVSGIGPCP
jgi:hypothetical protein